MDSKKATYPLRDYTGPDPMDLDEYPVSIHRINDERDEPYYMAYLPDFGEAACSAMGKTIEEALSVLEDVKKEVIEFYLEVGKKLPEPSRFLFRGRNPHTRARTRS